MLPRPERNPGHLRSLRQAARMQGRINQGWPDGVEHEKKIGSDSLRPNQWRRHAQIARYYGKQIPIIFAYSHEDALLKPELSLSITATQLVNRIGDEAILLWQQILKNVRKWD